MPPPLRLAMFPAIVDSTTDSDAEIFFVVDTQTAPPLSVATLPESKHRCREFCCAEDEMAPP
jgi:hypothetical protein